jgi:hypothetical protein
MVFAPVKAYAQNIVVITWATRVAIRARMAWRAHRVTHGRRSARSPLVTAAHRRAHCTGAAVCRICVPYYVCSPIGSDTARLHVGLPQGRCNLSHFVKASGRAGNSPCRYHSIYELVASGLCRLASRPAEHTYEKRAQLCGRQYSAAGSGFPGHTEPPLEQQPTVAGLPLLGQPKPAAGSSARTRPSQQRARVGT